MQTVTIHIYKENLFGEYRRVKNEYNELPLKVTFHAKMKTIISHTETKKLEKHPHIDLPVIAFVTQYSLAI